MFRKDPADAAYRPTDVTGAQPLSGMYISFADLSVGADTPVYGVSLVGNDEAAVGSQGSNLTTDGGANGGIDLIGGIFASAVSIGVPDATSGSQGAPQSSSVLDNDELAPARTATPVGYQATDDGGVVISSTYTPTVTPVTRPDTSSGPQGVAQTVDVSANDTQTPGVTLDKTTLTLVDGSGDPTASVTVPGQGTYTVTPEGDVTFTPLPAFVGTATPVTYRATTSAGGAVESTYTPTLVGVSPSSSPDFTTGPQGRPQRVVPSANDTPGDPAVPLVPSSIYLYQGGGPVPSITIVGQGTYTIDGTEIVFTPEPGLVGTATAAQYAVEDINGAVTSNFYRPTVTPVAQPDTSTGNQGVPQTVDVTANDIAPGVEVDPGTLTLVDALGAPATEVVIPGHGAYTISGRGEITFTPLPTFTGTATPVSYQVGTADGSTIQSTYTPTVVGVGPSATPDTTSGPQGVPQTVDPLANDAPGDPAVPLDRNSLTLLDGGGNPVASVTVPGEGTYTLGGDGIVFTPLPTFVGTAAPVTYWVADANGTTATTTYTPTVTAGAPTQVAPITIAAPRGVPVTFDLTTRVPGIVPSSIGLVTPDGGVSNELVVPGQGTWRIIPGTTRIVFTPVPGLLREPTPVQFRGLDAAGVPVTGVLAIDYDELATTGADAALPLLAALALLGAGGLALWLAQRRRGRA